MAPDTNHLTDEIFFAHGTTLDLVDIPLLCLFDEQGQLIDAHSKGVHVDGRAPLLSQRRLVAPYR